MQKSIYPYRKRLERVEELLEEVALSCQEGAIIIVEGKRDIASLEKLGIRGRIEPATHHSLITFSEGLAKTGKQLIILTDWDRRGDILAEKITGYLRNLGVEPDLRTRELLSSLVKKEVKDVESLYTYVVKLRDMVGYSQRDFLSDDQEFKYAHQREFHRKMG